MHSRFRRALIIVAVLVLTPLIAVLADSDGESPDQLLRQADAFFDEKSYGQALEQYEEYLASLEEEKSYEGRPGAMLNRGVCLYHLTRQDESLAALEEMATDPAIEGTVWEARGRYARAEIRNLLPDWYTRKYDEPEGERAWGRWIQQGSYFNAATENLDDAMENLRRARRVLHANFARRPVGGVVTAWEREFIAQVELDYAGVLERWDTNNSWTTKTLHRTLEDGREYSWEARIPAFEHRGEISDLYDSAERNFHAAAARVVVEADEAGGATTESDTRARELGWQGSKSLYRSALYLLTCAEMAIRYDPEAAEFPGAFPADKDPIPLLREVIERYPRSRRAPEALYSIALLYERMRRYNDALTVCAQVEERFPKSHWVSDARALVQQISVPRLTLDNGNTTIPIGGKSIIRITARNIDDVTFTTQRLDIIGLFRDQAFLDDFHQYMGNWGSMNLSLVSKYLGEVVRTWTLETGNQGNHFYRTSEPIDVELPEAGAYLVIAEADGLKHTALKIMSDTVLIEKSGPDATTMWVVGREKSTPVPNPAMLHKEYFGDGNRYWTEVRRDTGDEVGLSEDPRSEAGNYYSYGTVSLAVAPDGRFTLTDRVSLYYWYQNRGEFVANCGYTDRSVYRPNSTVHFRGLVRYHADDRYQNVPNARVSYTVYNPRGEKHATGSLNASEFGTYAAQTEIGDNPPLGGWRVDVAVTVPGKGEFNVDSIAFSIEEYKKPEFEVTVEPANDFTRLGEEVEATVHVDYYSGTPVAGAKVKARVFHKATTHTYHFPRPWDWFFGDWLWLDPDWWGGWYGRGWDGDLVTELDAEAGPDGTVSVVFPTELYKELGGFHEFTIKVEATDESRRTIEGEGKIIVSPARFSAFLDSRRRVYVEGDHIEFEIRTETPSGRDVASEGIFKLFKVRYELAEEEMPDGVREVLKREEIEVDSMEASSDEYGRGFVQWTIPTDPGTAGEYVARYLTDDGVVDVSADFPFWVAGPNYQGEETRFSNFQIVPEKRVYVEGETAKLLLLSAEQDVHYLYAVESGEGRVHHQVRHTPGAATVLEIPITADHVPNFFVDVVAVVNGVPQEQRVELFVPPVDRILNVAVEADAEEYLPGAEGTFTIKVTDSDGNPVVAEAGLGLVDESVFYIVPDRTPDPRIYFYKYRRTAQYRVYTSVYFHSYPRFDDANSYKLFDVHGLPESLGHYWYWVGWMKYDVQWRTNTIGLPNLTFGTTNVMPSEAMPTYTAVPAPTATDNPDHVSRLSALANAIEQLGFGDKANPSSGERRYRGGEGGAGAYGSDRSENDNAAPSAPESASRPGELGESMDELRRDAPGQADERLRGFAQGQAGQQGQAGGPVVVPTIRKNFADTAAWIPSLVTDADGMASATVTFPDNLTRWKGKVLVIDNLDRVGFAEISVRTNKNVIIRLQAPRFFTERDEVVVSAVVQNDLAMAKPVEISVELPEGLLAAMDGYPLTVTREVLSGGRTRVDWRVKVIGTGVAAIRMFAKTDVESDAQELIFPVLRHGMTKHEVATAVIGVDAPTDEAGHATATLGVSVPAERDPDQTQLRITVEPSLLNVAIQAVPYLIRYPYGCIEQTVSRFIPALVTRHTLQQMGIDLAAVEEFRRNRSVEDMPGNILASYKANPVFNELTLDSVIAACMTRIVNAQNGDGGWGWWPGSTSNPYMTAYVVHSLSIARGTDLMVDEGMLQRAQQYLLARYDKEMNLHLASFLAYVLAEADFITEEQLAPYLELIYEKREWLTHQGRAMLCLTEYELGHTEKAQVLARNISGYARVEERNDTAYWELPGSRSWWFWYHDRNETHAWILRALNAVDPTNPLLPKLVKFIANSRQGTRWQSTKATAYAVFSLIEYAAKHGELDANYEADIYLGDTLVRTMTVTPETIFTLNPDTILAGEAVPAGPLDVRVVRRGAGACYITANVAYYTLEENIPAAAHEAYIQREYVKLIEKKVTREDGRVYLEYDRVPIEEGDVLESGDRIEVVLTIESLNDYEYVCIEDPKPAGCEPVTRTSGIVWMGGLVFNREMRDEKVAFFITRLDQGTIRLKYEMRAEIPGIFHALPARLWAMYAPDVHANADEAILTIVDKIDVDDEGTGSDD